MNIDKQRAAIAEYCGWKVEANQYKRWTSPNGTSWNYPPQYDKDLNQMHEALKHLKDNYTSQDFQKARFINHLENIVSSEVPNGGWSFALTTATAAQKAEAFLKTIGKWEE